MEQGMTFATCAAWHKSAASFPEGLESGTGRLKKPDTQRSPAVTPAGEDIMFAMSVLLMLVLGVWLAVATIGLVFKLTFGLIGVLFSLVGAVLGVVLGGIALLVAAPLVALALLPLCLPVIVLAAIVWAIVRIARGPAQQAPVNAR
jgi:hypothetical protein